jgi:hypothetical protein
MVIDTQYLAHSKELQLSDEWQYVEVPFSELGEVNAVTSINFIGEGAFELWIDDLALLCAGSCPTL